MLVAYFDESGTHGQSRATVLAGFIATAEQWHGLESRWADALRRAGVEHFHAVDCWMGRGEFKEIDRPFRDALREDLITIICESGLGGAGSAVLSDAWAHEATQEFRQRCPSPYALCFNFLVQHLFRWSDRRANGEPFAVVFAEQREFGKHVAHIYDQYRASPHWGERLTSLRFGKPTVCVPLQAADLIARETWQYISARDESKQRRQGAYPDPPPSIARMMRAGIDFSGGMYDRWALRTLIANGENMGTNN